jgi:hypothetical protein
MATASKKKTPERLTEDNVGSVNVSPKVAEAAKEAVRPVFVCEYCNRKFKSRAGLASHVRANHQEDTSPVEEEEEQESEPIYETRDVEVDPAKFEPRISELDDVIKNRKENVVELLSKQKKVMFMIPLMPGEKPGATVEVGINGLVMVYPKGEYFEAPMSVVELLKEYEHVKSTSGAEYKVDRDEDTERALS